MIDDVSVTTKIVTAHSKESYAGNPTMLLFAVLFLGTGILLIPSLYVRAAIILIWGVLIFTYERYLDLPVPVTPGTMLWFGSTLSYVIGGIGTKLAFGQPEELGLPYLNSALLYLGLGLASYAFGLLLAGLHLGKVTRFKDNLSTLSVHPAAIWLVTALFILPVLGKTVAIRGGSFDIYYNLIIGALQSIEKVPMILLAFYLVQPRHRWGLGLLLLGATLAIPWDGILVGYGRNKLPFALIALLLTWLALVWFSGQRISARTKLLILLLPIGLIIFFAINTAYRNQVRFQSDFTTEERLQFIDESITATTQSENVITASIRPLLTRLVEKESLELLGWAEKGQIVQAGWTLSDTEQVILAWIPKFLFKDKGEGYGRDIMEYYGLSSASNNIPVTILTDAYRRLGVVGVLGIYFLMGIASTTVALKLMAHWSALGLVLVLFFALLHLTIYSSDMLEVLKLYIYRLPSSGLVIYAILRLTKMWQPQVGNATDK